MTILVTGSAGFIGAALTEALLNAGVTVVGIDSMTPYYDVELKRARLARVIDHPCYVHITQDLAEREAVARLFQTQAPTLVVHLAAQPGVRYSLEHPETYVDSNVVAFGNILEGCRHTRVRHLIFASSSSVYGGNERLPFSTSDGVDHPVSLYAATKRANELMAHTYAHLYDLPTTGLRFFTVYGPWGRPDMAPYRFTQRILSGEPIDVYNHGDHRRDFTYIDDIVDGIRAVIDGPAPGRMDAPMPDDPGTSSAPYRLYNIGQGKPVDLEHFIGCLERAIGRPATRRELPMQPGDIRYTWADITPLTRALGYRPKVDVATGTARFVTWFRDYHNL